MRYLAQSMARDVAADGATADAALPKAGGTMTGNLSIESAAPILTLKDTTDNDDQRINFVTAVVVQITR